MHLKRRHSGYGTKRVKENRKCIAVESQILEKSHYQPHLNAFVAFLLAKVKNVLSLLLRLNVTGGEFLGTLDTGQMDCLAQRANVNMTHPFEKFTSSGLDNNVFPIQSP